MNPYFAALALCALCQPALAEVVFRGASRSIQVQNCRNQGVGWDNTAVFHPRITGNDQFSSIGIFHPFGGISYETSAVFSKTAFISVAAHGVGWGHWSFNTAKVKILTSSPRSLTSISNSTRFVFLKFQIQGPDQDPGVNGRKCVVTYDASFHRQ